MESRTETDLGTFPPVVWKHKHTHTVIHLLLTNSSDNAAEFSINALIIHSDYASVKTKTFLSPLLSHIFFQKKDPIRNCDDLFEIQCLQQAGFSSEHSLGRASEARSWHHKEAA